MISQRLLVACAFPLRRPPRPFLKLDGNYVWKYRDFSVADSAFGPNQPGTWDFGPRLQVNARANTSYEGPRFGLVFFPDEGHALHHYFR